jgi:hypothetical protein
MSIIVTITTAATILPASCWMDFVPVVVTLCILLLLPRLTISRRDVVMPAQRPDL